MKKPQKQIDPMKVVKVLGALGATEAQMAEALGISSQALTKRKGKSAVLVATLKEAKAEADSKVEKSLYQRATGYECDDTYFSTHQGNVTATRYRKHYPPDTTACIFWLKNRKPKEWRDRAEVHLSEEVAGVPVDVVDSLRKRFIETLSRNGK